jgi:hypothetical protein
MSKWAQSKVTRYKKAQMGGGLSLSNASINKELRLADMPQVRAVSASLGSSNRLSTLVAK